MYIHTTVTYLSTPADIREFFEAHMVPTMPYHVWVNMLATITGVEVFAQGRDAHVIKVRLYAPGRAPWLYRRDEPSGPLKLIHAPAAPLPSVA